MKKTSLFLMALALSAIVLVSCGPDKNASGDPCKVLSKKVYSKVLMTYDDLYDFQNGLCKVRKGSYDEAKYGFINTKGEEVVPCKYENTGHCVDDMIWYEEKEKYGFLNRDGEVVVQPQYESIHDFSEGLACVAIPTDNAKYSWNKVYGFINKKGEVVVPIAFDYAESFAEGKAVVKKNKRYGYINPKGEFEIEVVYDEATSYSEGIAFVVKSGRVMAIDHKGEMVFALPEIITPKGLYHDGRAIVLKYGKTWGDDNFYGYIDKEGNVAIPCKYDDADDFENGVAKVEKNDRISYINVNGEEVEKPVEE